MEDWRQQQLLLSQSLSASSSLSSLSSLSLSSSSSSSLRPGPPAAYKLVATSVTHFGSARAEACLPSITTPLSRAVHHCVATDNAAKTASTAKTTGEWDGRHGCSPKTTEAQRAGILNATSQGGHFQDVGETGGAFPVLAPHCDELQNGCFREGVTPGWCGVASCRVVHRGTCSPATPRIVHSSSVKATAFATGGGRFSNDDGLTNLFIGSSGDSSDCGSPAPKNNVVFARKSLARPNVAVGTIELASGKIKEFSRQTQQAQVNAARRSPRRNKGASDAKAPVKVKHASRMKPISDPETSLCLARPSGRAGPDAAFDLLLPYLRQGLLVRLLEEAGASTGEGNTGSVEQFLSSLFASTTSAPSTAAFSSTEDIRACLQILVKCSEDLKRCTNIIKQCVDEKSQRDGKAVRAGCGSSTPDLHRTLPDTAGPEFLAAFLGGAVAAAAAAGFGSIAPPSYEDVVSSSSHPGRPATPLPPNEMPLRRSLVLKSSSSSHPTSKFTGRKPSNKTSSLFSSSPSPNSVAIVPPSQGTGADLLLLPTQAASEDCAFRSVDGGVADSGKLPHMLINSTNMAADFPQLLPAVEGEASIGKKREYDVDQILVELESISKEFSSPSPVKSNAKLDPAKGAKANDRNDNDEDEDKLLGKVLAVMEGLATDLAQCGATGTGARLSGEAQVRAKQDLMGLLMERLTTALQGPESGSTALAVSQERHAHQAAGADVAEVTTHLAQDTREESKPKPVLHNHLPHAPDPDPHPPSSRIHSLSSFKSSGESVPHSPVSSTRKSPAPALRGWNSRGPMPQSVLISEPTPPPPPPPPLPSAVVQNSPDPDLQIPIAFAQVPEPASPGREGVEEQGGAAGAVVVISSTVPPAPDSNTLRPGYETRNVESGVLLHDGESAVGFHASLLSSDDDVGKGERFGKGGGGGASSDEDLSGVMIALKEVFGALPDGRAYLDNMTDVTKACRCCPYWRVALFLAAHGEETGFVTMETFTLTWLRVTRASEDDAARFVSLLARPGVAGLTQEDFIPLVQDIVDTHPGLAFLKDAPEFHSRYITTVIQRIFYTVNRSWSGRITVNELRRSNFLQTLALVAEEDDINQVTEYFSYEHFYVIYCKFWELDTDHDLYISASDLARHSDGAISSCMIHRIFSGAVTRGSMAQQAGRMSYADFVWFLLSEEDKRTPTSIEYWFRCLDLDGDGVLSLYELEHFYSEQAQRMEVLGIEPLPFCDCVCQMLDLVKPVRPACVTLGDLKRCKMSHIFLDTFFNLEKYLDREQREPFAITRDLDGDAPELSDWERYAMEEYEMLVAKESEADQLTKGTSDEDIDDEDDILAAAELAGEINALTAQS